MKYFKLSALVGGAFLLCLSTTVQAAQQTISAISDTTTSRQDLRTKVNTELLKAQANDVDLDGRVTANKAAALVGDCTVGPCLDGSSDGGNLIKLWAGTGSYWTALQGGAPSANRSWRLPIAAAPSAGSKQVMVMDEYGQMAFLPLPSTSGYVLSSTDAGVLSWAAGGSGGASAIDDLTDVDTTGKATGKVLKFDASGNLVVGDDDTGTGSVPSGTVNGQILQWSTDQWVAGAIPTLNQNTTGSAATLTTARTIGGVSFNGSANINLPGVNAAGNQNTTGTAAGITGYTISTTVGATGADTVLVTEQGTREAINALPTVAAGTGITITDDGGGAGIDTINVTANTYQAYDADLTTWAGITPGTGVGTFLATPTSANLATALTNETGTGVAVFGTSPTIATPSITAAEVNGASSSTLTAAQVSSTIVYNTGMGGADVALTLPTAAAGYTALFAVGTAQSFKWGVRAGTGDKIYLLATDGTISAGSDNGYARMTAAQVGQSFACWTIKTDAYDWQCKAVSIGTSTFAAN